MNFNYSYRALLITCSLFGILFLVFKSIKLSKYTIIQEDSYNIEYTEKDIVPEEDMATVSKRDLQVETNRAYNEAEQFISEIEDERDSKFESANKESDENSATNKPDVGSDSPIGKKVVKNDSDGDATSLNGSEEKDTSALKNAPKKNSTVSYRLVGRSVMHLPNPVYTCDGFGKVIINIEVSATGRVIKCDYNAKGSTTTNQCLIDNAIIYAKKARFTTNVYLPKQLGNITYNFPGQQ
jgi:hypothetical protein